MLLCPLIDYSGVCTAANQMYDDLKSKLGYLEQQLESETSQDKCVPAVRMSVDW